MPNKKRTEGICKQDLSERLRINQFQGVLHQLLPDM